MKGKKGLWGARAGDQPGRGDTVTKFKRVATVVWAGAGLAAAALGQVPAPVSEPIPPPTKLEALRSEEGAVIFRGFTRVGGITGAAGTEIGVEAQEYTNAATGARERGIAVAIRPGGRDQPPRVALVDYDEIEPLVRGVDAIWRSGRAVTRLQDYQASYRTHGGFEVATFGRGQPGVAALSAGWTDRAAAVIPVSELQKLGELLAAAKAVLDAPAN